MTIDGLTQIDRADDGTRNVSDHAMTRTSRPAATDPENARELAREVAQLRSALVSNRRIGVAMGILMGDADLDEDEAFDSLRRASQNQNRKLREVAEEVIERRRLPAGGGASRSMP